MNVADAIVLFACGCSNGWAITLDTPVHDNGTVYAGFLQQLHALKPFSRPNHLSAATQPQPHDTVTTQEKEAHSRLKADDEQWEDGPAEAEESAAIAPATATATDTAAAVTDTAAQQRMSSSCIEYSGGRVAGHKVPGLSLGPPLGHTPALELKGNVYGVGGHRTSMRQCFFAGGADGGRVRALADDPHDTHEHDHSGRSERIFGWNWTRGHTERACADPEGLAGCKAPACFADFSYAGTV